MWMEPKIKVQTTATYTDHEAFGTASSARILIWH